MILNEWYAVLSSNEVKKNKVATVKRLGVDIAFFRDSQGKVWAIEDRCCHRGASLGAGKVIDDELQCPFHGFRYDGNGKVTTIPANGFDTPVDSRYKVRNYHVREVEDMIYLWWGRDYFEPDHEPKVFKDLTSSEFSYMEFSDFWAVHYTRAIENQLDVVHVPFVHKSTIGRGYKTLISGPLVVVTEDRIKFYVMAEVDDGVKKPLHPHEIKNHEKLNALEFQFPNTWHNIVTPDMRIFAAFAPVDEERTVIYIRYYQRFVKTPLLKWFVTLGGIWFSRIVLWQDKRVVLTQVPKYSEYRMNEKLIQGDLPIIEFRKMRARKIEEDENVL